MKTAETKKWVVKYDHHDGRKGTLNVTTEVGESQAFKYGNGKYGCLNVQGSDKQGYDLRYTHAKDLHRVMIEDYFGKGLVSAVEAQ